MADHIQKRWFPLDNAAHLFPTIESDNRTAVFRLAVTLKEEIRKEPLQKAVNRVLKRFPTFRVRLVRGIFWNVLDENRNPLLVEKDVRNPCMRLDYRRSKGHLLRVRYFKNRIAVEFFHSLTDGTGGMSFLLTLAAEYLSERGYSIPRDDTVLDVTETPSSEEIEDAFVRYHKPGMPRSGGDPPAFQYRGNPAESGTIHHIHGVIPYTRLKEAASRHSTSITVFLTAVYLKVLQDIQEQGSVSKRKAPIRLCIPVNLRNHFPSKTRRNFSHFLTPSIYRWKEEQYQFSELLHSIHHQLILNNRPRILQREFSPNVAAMTNPVIRGMPLFIKNLVIRLVSHSVGERLFSGMLSNLGNVTLPAELQEHVERLDFQLGPNRKIGSSLSMLGYNGNIYINFVRSTEDPEIERRFFRELIQQSVPVKIQSNWR